MKHVLSFLALTVGLGVANTAIAQDRILRMGPGVPSAHPAYVAYETFAENLKAESDGALGGQIFGPEIANVGGMKAALQSSVVEVGTIIPAYYASDLPNSALIAELTMLGNKPNVMMAAAADYTVNCAECLQEYTDAGFVFMGGGASSAYLLILKGKEVRTVEDLKGLKLRAGGPPNARWADALGASPVNVSVTETFEAISQGVVDGTMAGISDLLAFRLMDIADSVTTVELGSPYSIANFSPTVSVWASLDEDERADYVRAATRANASFTGDWGYRLPAGASGAAKKAGIVFNAPDPSLVDATNTFVQADIAALPEIAMVKFNIPDAAEKIATFQEYVAKWDTLLGNESGDPEKVAAIMQREIWDKVDYGKYGL